MPVGVPGHDVEVDDDHGLWETSPRRSAWKARFGSLPGFYYLAMFIMGAIALSLGVAHLFGPANQFGRGPATLATLVGIWFIGVTTVIVFCAATKIEILSDGSLSLSSRRRRKTFPPGEVRSVKMLPLDWNRLLPWWVRGTNGGMLIWPRFDAMEDLWRTFAVHSPDARN